MNIILSYIKTISTNNKGYLSPYLLFISLFFIISLTTTTTLLNEHVQSTRLLEQQLKLASIYQIASATFHQELNTLPLETTPKTILYTFPDGRAEVIYQLISTNQIYVKYQTYSLDTRDITVEYLDWAN